ncbi:MAG TPA: VOC family protein [Actinoplanes sp.]|jgi:predicted enzyme related to lactoylglutathione lyase
MSSGPARFGGRDDVVLAVVLDCSDLDRSAAFWCGVLGYRAEPSSPGRYQQLLPRDGNGVELLLQRVAEAKGTKNRLHLDLRVPDLDAETARVMALGARRVTVEPIEEHGWIWHVLADPDGNEFCVLQPPTDLDDDRPT